MELVQASCWFHGPRIISAASNLVFWTFFRAKTCCLVCHSYCVCYSATNMARKKPRSIQLLRWFDISQSENRKNNSKTFERASVEPTNQTTSRATGKSKVLSLDVDFLLRKLSHNTLTVTHVHLSGIATNCSIFLTWTRSGNSIITTTCAFGINF